MSAGVIVLGGVGVCAAALAAYCAVLGAWMGVAWWLAWTAIYGLAAWVVR